MGPTEAAIDALEGLVYRRRRVILGLGYAYTLANHIAPTLTTRVLNDLSLAFPTTVRPYVHVPGPGSRV